MSRRFFSRWICDTCGAELDSEAQPPGWYEGRVNKGTRDIHFCPEHGQEIRAAEAAARVLEAAEMNVLASLLVNYRECSKCGMKAEVDRWDGLSCARCDAEGEQALHPSKPLLHAKIAHRFNALLRAATVGGWCDHAEMRKEGIQMVMFFCTEERCHPGPHVWREERHDPLPQY